jgi:hypothetical protein
MVTDLGNDRVLIDEVEQQYRDTNNEIFYRY